MIRSAMMCARLSVLQMIKDEETHTDYLEAQLRVISEVGIQNYLSEQMQGG